MFVFVNNFYGRGRGDVEDRVGDADRGKLGDGDRDVDSMVAYIKEHAEAESVKSEL